MEFYIKKNATLPLLKLQVVKDGRSDFRKFMDMIEVSALFFSMVDVETGIPKITSRPAGFVEKTFDDPNAEPEYYIYYQFTPKDTIKVGRYEGQFMLRSPEGNLILPIREKLYIDVQESFIADELEYTTCYVSDFPCCVNGPYTTTTTTVPCVSCPICPSPTPTPTSSNTPLPTSTPTPTPTASPIVPPPNDLTYLLIPSGDTYYELLTGITIDLQSTVTPGSIILDYLLTSNQTMSSGLTMSYTHNLGLTSGGTINVAGTTTIMPGQTSGSSQIILSQYNYEDLNGTSSFTNVSFTPNTYDIVVTNKNTIFEGPTPTPTPTNTSTPTPTPTPTQVIPLGNVNLLVLGDSNVPVVGSAIQTRLNDLNYTCNLTTRQLSTTYDGYEITGGTFDVVVMYTNSFEVGTVNLSTNLQYFVNNGGGLVTGTFLWNLYPPNFDFNLTPWVGGVGQVNDTTGAFTILNPSLILNGINSPIGFQLINNVTTLQSGSILNAQYDTSGYGYLATREYGLSRQVGINAFLGNISNFSLIELRNTTANSVLWAAKLIDPPSPTPTPTPTPTSGPVILPDFISIWRTTSPNETIVLPYEITGTYSGTIDWGDGNIDTNSYSNNTHTYSTPGDYTIKITGQISGFCFFNESTSVGNIIEITQFGPLEVSNSPGQFGYCSNLVLTGVTDTPILSGVTTTKAMFRNCSSITIINNLNSWNVSSVTEMRQMFKNCTSFDQSLNNWNVSNVTDLSQMFTNTIFNQDISMWDVSNVSSFADMFFDNTVFNQNINVWNTSAATLTNGMFYGTTSFDQPLSGWNMSNVIQTNAMFYGSAFNQDISGWDVSSVTFMDGMFANSPFDQNIGGWVVSGVTTMYDMFNGSSFNQDISNWDVSNVNSMDSMFYNNANFNQDLSSWCVLINPSHTDFDTGATSWVLPRPNWGTCPP